MVYSKCLCPVTKAILNQDLELGISALGDEEPVKVGKHRSYMVRSVFKKVIQEAPSVRCHACYTNSVPGLC